MFLGVAAALRYNIQLLRVPFANVVAQLDDGSYAPDSMTMPVLQRSINRSREQIFLYLFHLNEKLVIFARRVCKVVALPAVAGVE